MLRIIQKFQITISLIVIVLTVTVLAGCQSVETKKFQAGQNDYGSRSKLKSNHMNSGKLYGYSVQGGRNHENTHLHYSKELSTAISDMSGIFSGLVMVTDKNAYAAIIFDNSATGLKARNTPDESDMIGTTRGMYDVYTGNQTADPNQIATGINSYFTEKNPDNLSSDLKQKIALKLRELKPQILEVYITANRDFINQMNVYYTESALGVNLDAYLTDFNKLVKEHFPITE